nr:helix-turn-helix domain-containing protein [Acidobacteriota bacterium]
PSVCTLLFNYVDTRTHEFFIDGSYPDPDLIRDVYAWVIGAGGGGRDVVELTAREIAPRIHIKNEMAINSALGYLEKAGHIERGQGMNAGGNSGIRVIDRVARQALRVNWTEIASRRAADERKLREMLNYAYHEDCLRRFILRYFGDRKQAAHCRCSNCQPVMKWKEIEEAVEALDTRSKRNAARPAVADSPEGPRALSEEEHLAVRKILSCVARMDGKFGKGTVAGVLRGSRAKNITANELDQLTTFGLLRDYSQDELTRFLNALIVSGAVQQSSGARPVISLTELGRQVMLNRQRIQLDLEGVAADLSDEVNEQSERAEIERQITNRPSETQEETFRLYQQGLSISEIAAERELKASTIEVHLATLIADGRAINLDTLVAPADQALIEAAAERCRQAGQIGLSPIKGELPEHIGYGAIRMVLVAAGQLHNKD